MEIWTVLRWLLSITAGAGTLYGLHRLALRMEERGLIYYLRKKPSGSSALGSFVALQKALEPRAEYVLRAPRAYHQTDQEAGQGNDPPSLDLEEKETEGQDPGPP